MRRLFGIINSIDISLSKLQETVKSREAWLAAVWWNHNDSHMNHWGLNNNNGIVVLYNQGREVKEEKKKNGKEERRERKGERKKSI